MNTESDPEFARFPEDDRDPNRNPDPITHAPGAHPVGTGLGAVGTGTAATVVGSVIGGPIGGVVGAVVGAVAGGYAGKAVAESIDPTEEDTHWRGAYRNEPYYREDFDYDHDYAPAYRTGYAGYQAHGRERGDFADSEEALRADYERNRGTSRLEWNDARLPALAAWERAQSRAVGGTGPGAGGSGAPL